MKYLKLPNAASTQITVTNVATDLYDLIQAAAGQGVDFSDFEKRKNEANGISIQVEGAADIRFIMDGNVPTADVGTKIGSGFFESFELNPWKMKLISTGEPTAVNIQIFITRY